MSSSRLLLILAGDLLTPDQHTGSSNFIVYKSQYNLTMGQYHQVYNTTKKETVNHDLFGGLHKLLEWGFGAA